MNTLEFDAAAYRRIRLPWLLLTLFLSLIIDVILLIIYRKGVNAEAQFYWNISFAFFGLANLLFIKGTALKKYMHIKKMRKRSYVRLEKNAVAHYVLHSRLSHWKVEQVKETKFDSGGKNEYISAETFYIRQVIELKRKPNGSIIIDGTIERESLNEGWEEYCSEYGKVFVKPFKRHTIPGYYNGMDAIFEALNKLKQK